MAVREHEYHNPFGVVQTDGMVITRFAEKPVWRTRVNGGIYVPSSLALDHLIPNALCNMPTLFLARATDGRPHHRLSDARDMDGCRQPRRSVERQPKAD